MARLLRFLHQVRSVCVAAPLLLLAVGGCGLADYESKMERGQKLIEFIDKQNVYLGNPIEPPPPEKAPAGPDGTVVPKPKVELFLRLPKGIETKPEPATMGPILYRYPKEVITATRPSAKAGPIPKGLPEFQEVLVAMSTERGRDEFWTAILSPFGAVDTSTMTRETLQAPGRPSLMFEKLSFNASLPLPNSYNHCFVHQAQNVMVGIVYSVPVDKANDPEIKAAMEASLMSLAVGPEAAQARARFHPPS
jgi:hypothetical protein